ncbi:MAG: S8/S53 family peptidase [Fibromonadales bacterium]|nr:S8/S53 family peptidase [Fibromonadales bacterium]
MNIDDYLKNYSGYGITVTIIDTGVTLDRENIIHYRYETEDIVNCSAIGFGSNHGTICAETILRLASNVKLNDICIEENGDIIESALICALNFAHFNLDSDIICICLALDEYSISLAKILKEFENTFIFASGRKNKLSYPSDLSNVIKVYYDSEVSGVEIISENAIAVNYEEIKSSSLACAYISGLFSVILEAKALWQFDDIKKWIFPGIRKSIFEHDSLILPEKFIAIFPVKYLVYKDNFIDNLVGYYDDDMVVRNFDCIQLLENYKTVYINTDERTKVISPTTVGDYFVGNFINGTLDNKIQLKSHYSIESDYICDIAQPIITLASFGYGASKFDLQLKVHNNISKLGYNAKCLTYNPMGILFKDFVVFEYPKQIICPNFIYSINKFIYELSITNDTDIFILNVGGSIRAINYHNSYDMGMLFEAYIKAFRIDIILLCVNINVSIDAILFEIERLKATGITEVIIVVSDNEYDNTTYETSTGMKYFKCSDDKQYAYAEKLRDKYCFNLVHLLDDFNSLDVNEVIIKKFT